MSEERRAKNREAVKRRKSAHPDRVREYQKQYHLKNRERRLHYFREYHQEVRDKARRQDEMQQDGAEE